MHHIQEKYFIFDVNQETQGYTISGANEKPENTTAVTTIEKIKNYINGKTLSFEQKQELANVVNNISINYTKRVDFWWGLHCGEKFRYVFDSTFRTHLTDSLMNISKLKRDFTRQLFSSGQPQQGPTSENVLSPENKALNQHHNDAQTVLKRTVKNDLQELHSLRQSHSGTVSLNEINKAFNQQDDGMQQLNQSKPMPQNPIEKTIVKGSQKNSIKDKAWRLQNQLPMSKPSDPPKQPPKENLPKGQNLQENPAQATETQETQKQPIILKDPSKGGPPIPDDLFKNKNKQGGKKWKVVDTDSNQTKPVSEKTENQTNDKAGKGAHTRNRVDFNMAEQLAKKGREMKARREEPQQTPSSTVVENTATVLPTLSTNPAVIIGPNMDPNPSTHSTDETKI